MIYLSLSLSVQLASIRCLSGKEMGLPSSSSSHLDHILVTIHLVKVLYICHIFAADLNNLHKVCRIHSLVLHLRQRQCGSDAVSDLPPGETVLAKILEDMLQ